MNLNFQPTPLSGAYLISPKPHKDERGFFARTWCLNEFNQMGIDTHIVQTNISYNRLKGTFRGMHYQKAPYEEGKIVSCTKGSIYDIIVDLRPESNTFLKWFSVKLTAQNRKMLFVPKGFAHGFITLKDHTQVFYMMTEFYHPNSAAGFRWNDPTIGITLPTDVAMISDRDAHYPDLDLSSFTDKIFL